MNINNIHQNFYVKILGQLIDCIDNLEPLLIVFSEGGQETDFPCWRTEKSVEFVGFEYPEENLLAEFSLVG
jgi:hypothetical protein